MNLTERQDLFYVLSNDPGRKLDPGLVATLLDTGERQFAKVTGIFRLRAQVAVVSGVGVLNGVPDSVNLGGRVLRVEDANNGNRALEPTSENQLDVLPGPQWRQDSQGPIKAWYRGTPNEGQQDGYGTIGVWPAVASGTLNVFYVATPRKMNSDADHSDVPEQYQIASVWYAIQMALLAKPEMEKALMLAAASWQAEVDRATAETALWITRQGA